MEAGGAGHGEHFADDGGQGLAAAFRVLLEDIAFDAEGGTRGCGLGKSAGGGREQEGAPGHAGNCRIRGREGG